MSNPSNAHIYTTWFPPLMEAHFRNVTAPFYRAILSQANPKRYHLQSRHNLLARSHLPAREYPTTLQLLPNPQHLFPYTTTSQIAVCLRSSHLKRSTSSMASHALSTIEASKRRAAYKAVEDHFDPSYRCIGIGSGSTVVYVVKAIAEKGPEITSKMIFIPTGDQSKELIIEAGLPLGSIDALPPAELTGGSTFRESAHRVATGKQDTVIEGNLQSLDVAFDGADEIDEELNCIKGGGACLAQEKLVAISAKKFICVADYRKLQKRLLTSWKTIPIEIMPKSAPRTKRVLMALGSPEPKIRQGGSSKAGPVVTDNGQWIIDAPFAPLLIPSDLKEDVKGNGENGVWEVHALAQTLIQIPGVLEVGLFHGRNGFQAAELGEEGGGQKPVAAYFGMENGEVEVRVAKGIGSANSR